jgi:hypothetical protein
MGDLTVKGNRINYSPDEIKGLTLSKVIKADNKGDAMAIFRNRYDLSPNTTLDVDAMKKEGRDGSINFKITAKFNKGGHVKQYARGGSTRKVNR